MTPHATQVGPSSERGAALLAVMAMVMVLGGFATLGLSRLRHATNHLSDAQARSDAGLIAHSASLAGLGLVRPFKAQIRGNPTLANKPITLSMGAGQAHILFEDAGNCFNLNSLVKIRGNSSTGDQASQGQAADLTRLLTAAGIPQLDASAIAQNTATHLKEHNLLWADGSEWATINGVTPAYYQLVSPLLCALPNREATALNINSLKLEQAPLLAAMGLTPDEARRALASRPTQGWSSSSEFWQQASDTGMPDTASAQVLGTTSRWMFMHIQVHTPLITLKRQILIDTLRDPAEIVSSRWISVQAIAPKDNP